jgi:hypothetical protein
LEVSSAGLPQSVSPIRACHSISLIRFNLPELPVLFYTDFTRTDNIKIINANMGNLIFLLLTSKSSIVKLGQKGNMAAFRQKDLAKKEGMENEGFIYDRRSRGSL